MTGDVSFLAHGPVWWRVAETLLVAWSAGEWLYGVNRTRFVTPRVLVLLGAAYLFARIWRLA